MTTVSPSAAAPSGAPASVPSAALRIGAFSAGFTADRLTPALVEACGRALLDTCAVGIAGWHEDATVRMLRYAASGAAGGGALQARLWGGGGTLPVEMAALCNGVAAHVLDYDDVTSPLRGHPSVAMLPALVALGEAIDAPGAELACAYVVGFEVVCRLARAIAVDHYARGWHSTASIGTLAAAVACARLLRLDARQTAHAIGLAVAQAAGTRANFGTHAKSFQAGQCNAAGLRAALLAREGFDASTEVLEGAFGYLALVADGAPLTLDGWGEAPFELERSGIEVKKYPLCYATHRVLDGLLDLRAAHGLTLEAVRAVAVRTSRGALTPLVHHRPRTGLEAKFSMEYAVAAALHDGHVGLASFTDAAVCRTALQAALPRVQAASADAGEVFPRWAEIDLRLADGGRLHTRVETLRGAADAPLTLDELRTKVGDCLAWGRSSVDADALCARALRIDRLPVRDLLAQP